MGDFLEPEKQLSASQVHLLDADDQLVPQSEPVP